MKKALLLSLLMAMLACVFAITVSAETETVIPEWTETQTISTITVKEGFDTTSRVLLENGDGTYTTYPTNYIIDGSDAKFTVSKELNFEALNNATGKGYTYASVIRIEIPVGFVSVDGNTFRSGYGFESLLTCKIPEGVTTFGNYVFYKNCIIVDVELPNSLTSLGSECFRESTSLKKVSVGSNTVITENAFLDNTALETVVLAEGITSIGARAFRTTSSLTQITIPSTVISIGDYAFYNSGLTDVIIPENVKTMGNSVFGYSESLTSAVVKSKVLGTNAFIACSNLSKVSITGDIESIGSNALHAVSKTLLTIYTGSDASTLGTLYAKDIFTKADTVTYEQHLLNVDNGVTYTKATIVYGANECYALYNGIHQEDNNPCVINCSQCNSVGVAEKNPVHSVYVTISYANGYGSEGSVPMKDVNTAQLKKHQSSLTAAATQHRKMAEVELQ